MKNKYWILILIGIIILSCVGGFLSYETGYNEGHNSGYFFGEANILSRVNDCMNKCQSFFGNIKWNCFKTCIYS